MFSDHTSVSQPTSLARWKGSVIHLEGAADSDEARAQFEEGVELIRRLSREGAAPEKLEAATESLTQGRDLRFRGTATFVQADGGEYLVTARHVIRDDNEALRRVNEVFRRNRNPAETPAELAPHERELFERYVFGIVFRIPGLDEALYAPQSPAKSFLMNLGAGLFGLGPYVYSSPALDLAVISLGGRGAYTGSSLKVSLPPVSVPFPYPTLPMDQARRVLKCSRSAFRTPFHLSGASSCRPPLRCGSHRSPRSRASPSVTFHFSTTIFRFFGPISASTPAAAAVL